LNNKGSPRTAHSAQAKQSPWFSAAAWRHLGAWQPRQQIGDERRTAPDQLERTLMKHGRHGDKAYPFPRSSDLRSAGVALQIDGSADPAAAQGCDGRAIKPGRHDGRIEIRCRAGTAQRHAAE
jgi:hypothetical protein